MTLAKTLLAAAGSSSSDLSTEGIYANLIYEGGSNNRTVTTGVPVYTAETPTITIPHQWSGTQSNSINSISVQPNDFLIVFVQGLFTTPTLYVNGSLISPNQIRSNVYGYSLGIWVYKFTTTQANATYQVPVNDYSQYAQVLLVRGAMNARVSSAIQGYSGDSFTAPSIVSNGSAFLFVSDRDSGLNPTAGDATQLTSLDQNVGYFTGRVWRRDTDGPEIGASGVSGLQGGSGFDGDYAVVTVDNSESSPGLLMISQRTGSAQTYFVDTIRGRNQVLKSALASPQETDVSITGWSTTGFTVVSGSFANFPSNSYLVRCFKKERGFFDMVTWVGNGTARTIPHELGTAPGVMLIKAYTNNGAWIMYHKSLGPTKYLTTSITVTGTQFNNTAPTGSVISIGPDSNINEVGTSYIAYLFGDSEDGKFPIRCGSFIGTSSSTTAPFVDLGWQPQDLWLRRSDTANYLGMYSDSQGFSTPWATATIIMGSTVSDQNIQQGGIQTTTTGFFPRDTTWQVPSDITYFMAIRRPDTEPTSGVQVFNPVAYTATNTDGRKVATTIYPDLVLLRVRGLTTASTSEFFFADRQSGSHYIGVGTTGQGFDSDSLMAASAVGSVGSSFATEAGFGVGNDLTRRFNTSADQMIAWCWKRGYKFFDTQVFTRTANAPTAQTIKHNLGVVPEMIWARRFAAAGANMDTVVYTNHSGATNFLSLRSTAIPSSATNYWGNTAPTDTEFTYSFGASGETHVAWLFASLPGISKLGTYVGNGGSLQTINCGFATGARFVLIKAVSDLGDWWVFDTARGFSVSLKLNLTTAEQSAPSYVGSTSSGFTVSNVNVNANGVTYYYYAIA